MAGEIKLPVIGQVKTGWAIGGAGIVAVIVGFAYLRRNSGSQASAAQAGTIDPQTGYPSGSAEDQAALAAQDGTSGTGIDPQTGYPYGSPGDQGALSGGSYGAYDGYGYDPYATGAGSNANTGPGTFTDNAAWVQYCEQNVQGYSAVQVQGALAAAIAGVALTQRQMSIYQACVAVGGPPPTPITPKLRQGGGTGGHEHAWDRKITVGGKGYKLDVQEIARAHHVTEDQLVDHNPELGKYVGTRKPIPVKIIIVVP